MLVGQREVEAATAEHYGAAGFWPGRLLTDSLAAAVARAPGRVAVVDDRFGAVTYARLATEVERLACGLRALGVGRGDFFVVQLPNWRHVTTFHLALTALGAITVNVPATYRHHELRYILGLTGARGLVCPATFRGFDFVAMARALRAEVSTLRVVLAIGGRDQSAAHGYETCMAQPWEERGRLWDLDPLAPRAVTAVSFTSGTTGEPKGVMHTSDTFAAINTSVARAYDLTERDVIFMPAPVGHSIGLMHGVRLAVFLGGTLVLQEQWEPGAAIALMARERATFTATAPPFLHDLLAHPALAAAGGLPSLRVFMCGGAFVPERLLREARAGLPRTLTTALWGMTEGIGSACRIDAPEEKLFTTDGRPFPGTELRVVSPEGEELPPGHEGELVMRGPQLFVGYFRRPELNAAAFRPDGLFRTGDLARVDADGYVRITGRIKDLIVRGGVNISPVEVERMLAEDPRIERVAVIGMPDERLGERVCAFVVPRAGAAVALADLAAIAERHGLAKQKWPERVEVVSDLPTTPSGKVLRHVLRARLAEAVGGAPGGRGSTGT